MEKEEKKTTEKTITKKETTKKVEKKETKKTNKNKLDFTVKMEGKEWEDAIDKAFQKRNKEAKIDGFRPGKAPKDVFIKKYGVESLYFDAADLLLQPAYAKLMENEKVIPVCEPQVNIKSLNEKGVEFIFTIITKPEVKIKKYKGLGVKKETVKVTKEEIDHEISHLLEKYAELEVKTGKVENGDTATIDFEGFKDGVAFEGGKGENYPLEIGSNTFIPGFEEQLIGMEIGEEKEIKVTFPKEYGEPSLAGKDATFKVKVNDLKVKVLPELNKDFFDDLQMDGIESEKDLRESIEDTIKARKTTDAENKFVDEMLDKIAENTEVEIPEEMVDEEVHRLIHRFEEQLRMQGASLDLYYEFTKATPADLHNQMEPEAHKNVEYRLILEELVKLEKVEVTLEEGEKEAEELAAKYGMEKSKFLEQTGGLDMIMYDLEIRRVFDKLKEYNK